MRTGTLVVAALVVLAGCNAFVPGETEPTPERTLTPVPVETGTPTPTATPRPTGFGWLVAGGVETQTLFEEHASYLAERSFTLTWSREATGGEGPTADSFDRRVAVQNNSTYDRRDVGDGEVVRTYVDPSGLYRRVTAANGSTRTGVAAADTASARTRFALLGGSIVDLVFVTDDARVEFVDRNGTRYAVLFSSTPPDYLRALYGGYTIENFSATVYVHPDRYVRTVYYEFTLVNEVERVEIGERYSYSRVGETTVRRPAWADDLGDPGAGTETPTNGTRTPTR